jgi:hypothetical protein
MTTPAIPQVDCERHHPSLSVSDVLVATDFYIKNSASAWATAWPARTQRGSSDTFRS